MPKKKAVPTIQDLQKQIQYTFEHWTDIHRHGTQDPSHTDGTNLDLIRSHIIYYQGELRAKCKADKVRPCPNEVKRKLPKVVPIDYCAPKSKAGPCRKRR
jgi:hypothetical protein